MDLVGVPLPEETISVAKESDAVLLGAIGGYYCWLALIFFFCHAYSFSSDHNVWYDFRYKWDNNEKHLRPEKGLLQLRAGLKVFANLRPATVLPQVTILSLISATAW